MHKANSIDKKKNSVVSPHTHHPENPNDFGRVVDEFKRKTHGTDESGMRWKTNKTIIKKLICFSSGCAGFKRSPPFIGSIFGCCRSPFWHALKSAKEKKVKSFPLQRNFKAEKEKILKGEKLL